MEAAIRLIATLHARFASDPVLAECRFWGEDHGMGFYDQSVRGAIAAVVAAIASGVRSRHRDAVRGLLERLERLADDRDHRAGALVEFGGPDTLLHGDLWLSNVAVLADSAAHAHAGLAPPCAQFA